MEAGILREAVASLYDDTPDAVVLYGRDGVTIAANEAAQLLVGYSAHEMVGSPYTMHVSRADLDRVNVAVQTALAGGTDHFDTDARHRDGTLVPVECYIFPARFGEEIVGVFAQARDIVALRTAEQSLQLNQERFRSLFEYHPDGIMELKGSGEISRVNVALESETGFYGEQVVGRAWTDLVAPEHRDAADEALREAMRGEAMEQDSLLLDRLGNRIDVQLKLVPVHAGPEIRGAYAIFKNVQAQKIAERAIADQSEQIRRLYMVAASRGQSLDDQIDASLRLGVELFGWDQGYVTRFDGDTMSVVNAAGSGSIAKGTLIPITSTFSRHVRGERTMLFIGDMDAEEWREDPGRGTTPWRSYLALQLTVFDKVYGTLVFAARSTREPMTQSERDIVQLMGVFVSAALERAAQNDRIEQMAFNDSLTGLPNRVLFSDRIANTMATARRYDRGFAVMYLDIDKFKDINDEFGHSVGDAALIEVAKRLRTTLRESDTVARFGGDEFVILQPIVDGSSDAADLARKLNVAMQRPIGIEGRDHAVRVSIGIAIYPGDGGSIEALMEAADRALYRAKREGRNRWCFANADLARQDLRKKRVTRRTAAE